MNREIHVRFWEGLTVRFRWATQLSYDYFKVGYPAPRWIPILIASLSGRPQLTLEWLFGVPIPP
jgi:hypothetical protein